MLRWLWPTALLVENQFDVRGIMAHCEAVAPRKPIQEQLQRDRLTVKVGACVAIQIGVARSSETKRAAESRGCLLIELGLNSRNHVADAEEVEARVINLWLIRPVGSVRRGRVGSELRHAVESTATARRESHRSSHQDAGGHTKRGESNCVATARIHCGCADQATCADWP
jgi:hypothetical protein